MPIGRLKDTCKMKKVLNSFIRTPTGAEIMNIMFNKSMKYRNDYLKQKTTHSHHTRKSKHTRKSNHTRKSKQNYNINLNPGKKI